MKTRAYLAAAVVAATAFAMMQSGREEAVYAGQNARADGGGQTPTWSHDIAPIVYRRCAACHHPSGAGPFSLLTYADARRWGPQVMAVTQSHFMPPWLPEPGYGDFADVRRLSDRETALIREWVKGRMPEGDAAQAPAVPQFDGGWVMGKPDLILKVARPYKLVASGTDVFRNFILPYPLAETHYIRAMQILPGTPQIVHHANITIDRMASLRRHNPGTWQDGLSGMELYVDAGNRFDPDSHFLFWKPDTPALIEPKGLPWRLDPGNDLILNMHLKPSGKPETLDAQVGLYFTDKGPTSQPMLIALERDDKLDIPAGDKDFVVEDELTLPVDVEALGVYPHAHYLGHDLEGWATVPSGEKKWLIWIRNWDIDRQSIYRYREPLLLPKGTVLHMRYSYDNSSGNVHNPHSPPVRVKAGNRSEDEMAHLWLQLLPVHAEPGGMDPRLLLEEAWMRNRVRKTPRDELSLYNLGAALTGERRFEDAAGVYRQILKQNPSDERTLTSLGVALDGEGNWRGAEEQFRAAVSVSQTACDARFDLANLELQHQRPTSAEADFRGLLAACAPDAETHAGLAAALADEGRNADAAAEFGEALKLNPDHAASLAGLASIELNANDVDAAIEHLRRAVGVDDASPDVHEQLARAYAMAGDQQKALDELRAAARLKPDDAQTHSALSQLLAGQGNLAEAIKEERTALKLVENDADGWNNLGVMLLRSGKTAEAKAALEHALRLQPDHVQARANLERLKDSE
jgi:Flp pilus assembly protein TadD/mono/diheme cytochrome c family protein